MAIVTSQVKVAKHFQVSLTTIHHWKVRGMPGEPGRYDIEEITEWRRSTFRRGTGELVDCDPRSRVNGDAHNQTDVRAAILAADLKKKEAQAGIESYKLRRMTDRTLVELPDVERFLSELFTGFRRRLMRLPEKLSGMVAAKNRRRFVDDMKAYLTLELQQTANDARKLADLLDEEE
jgi:hypothetical protein